MSTNTNDTYDPWGKDCGYDPDSFESITDYRPGTTPITVAEQSEGQRWLELFGHTFGEWREISPADYRATCLLCGEVFIVRNQVINGREVTEMGTAPENGHGMGVCDSPEGRANEQCRREEYFRAEREAAEGGAA